MSENNSAQSAASGRNQKLLLAAFGVIIVVLVGVIVAISNRPAETSGNADAAPQRAVLITEDNVEEAIAEMSQPVEAPPSYRVRMSTTWNFENGEAVSSDAYVENAKTNTTPVYFDVILETGETVLESPVIPIGESMKNIKLDTPLPAGRYSAVIVYHLVDENQATLTTVRMGVTLVIAN